MRNAPTRSRSIIRSEKQEALMVSEIEVRRDARACEHLDRAVPFPRRELLLGAARSRPRFFFLSARGRRLPERARYGQRAVARRMDGDALRASRKPPNCSSSICGIIPARRTPRTRSTGSAGSRTGMELQPLARSYYEKLTGRYTQNYFGLLGAERLRALGPDRRRLRMCSA